jgi:hypothetical protein
MEVPMGHHRNNFLPRNEANIRTVAARIANEHRQAEVTSGGDVSPAVIAEYVTKAFGKKEGCATFPLVVLQLEGQGFNVSY